ncbi:HdeD family acid-resistance protein [Methanospirillum sp.]|uniref:HdeD family acid-resistance protein n=1 Tax=Methanospirillum sp. TaxID=45200 RepID=UPI00359FF503
MDSEKILAIVSSVVILLFGIISVTAPSAVFDFLVLLVGIIFLVLGVLTAGLALSAEGGTPKMILLGSGLISVLIGLLAIISPYVATIAIGYLIALWLVLNGVMTIAYAASISWEKHRILTGIGGVISLLLGIYLFINPGAGTALIILILGIFFVISGVISLILSLFYWKK